MIAQFDAAFHSALPSFKILNSNHHKNIFDGVNTLLNTFAVLLIIISG